MSTITLTTNSADVVLKFLKLIRVRMKLEDPSDCKQARKAIAGATAPTSLLNTSPDRSSAGEGMEPGQGEAAIHWRHKIIDKTI